MDSVAVIMPVHNAEAWLEEAIMSAVEQTFPGLLEISVYNDASSDPSGAIIENLGIQLAAKWPNRRLIISGHAGQPRGCGFAKNRAVAQSTAEFLCFLDADDVMMPGRVEKQLALAKENPSCIIGCQFHRQPVDSTIRFAAWANQLPGSKLCTQVYTSHGPTVIMPTWFMRRPVFANVGGFNDTTPRGYPEDLEFFYRHLDAGGGVLRVDEDLLMYRYHPAATTFSVHEDAIFQMRLRRLCSRVISTWPSFTVWNAGKQGRKFYRALPPEYRDRVAAFCDVDAKKIGRGWYTFEESLERPKPRIPIVHFSCAKPPLIVCAKLDLTAGQLEANLASLRLTEGVDYHWFS